MADPLVYVYAIGNAALANGPGPQDLTGVDGSRVRLVVSGPLAAAVGSVDPTRFSKDALHHSLDDLGWLEETARAHHHVVDALAQRHPVLPVRMATIYIDDDGVRAMLDEHGQRVAEALERTRGRAEWGVKAFAVPTAEQAPVPEQEPATGPGAAYLRRKKAVRDRALRAREVGVDHAEQVHSRLAGLAVASRRYPPQDPRLSGRSEQMVLNAAYLLDEAGVAALHRTVEEWRGTGLRIELTGPWAPYSFAALEEDR
jgi:hypothetical protein